MMRGSRVALYSPKNDPSTDVLPAGRVLLVTVRPVKLLKIAEPVWPGGVGHVGRAVDAGELRAC